MSAETYTEDAALPPRMLKVIDVSAVQGAIDWKAVAGDGIVGAYLKCTEGMRHSDGRYTSNFTGARDAGIACGRTTLASPRRTPALPRSRTPRARHGASIRCPVVWVRPRARCHLCLTSRSWTTKRRLSSRRGSACSWRRQSSYSDGSLSSTQARPWRMRCGSSLLRPGIRCGSHGTSRTTASPR